MRERLSVLGQLFRFATTGGRWWLLPVLVGLVVVGILSIAGTASPLTPFLYPLF